ncbi:MAG: VOC family protein [Nevskia sp.]|nr:VOC family protein [Nevskia sp.]
MKTSLLLCPVDDLDAAVSFYRDALGLTVKFRDGDRYCAIDAGGCTLGLTARDERVAAETAPAFRVDDIEQGVRTMLAAGARLARPPQQGPHETRAVLTVPGGTTVVLYAQLPAAAAETGPRPDRAAAALCDGGGNR